MKHLSFGAIVLGTALLVGSQPALAEGWSLKRLVPLGNSKKTSSKPSQKPSLLKQLDSGTKRFSAGTRELLTFKNPLPKPQAPKPLLPWQQPSKPSKPKKKPDSILTSWWQPKKPKPPESLDEFMSLKRMDP
jgi:hypothetical protein